MTDIQALNAIITQLGGSTTYTYNIDAYNGWSILQGGTGVYTRDIDALNAIDVLNGGAGGHRYNIDALNSINLAAGGTGGYIYDNPALVALGTLLNYPPAYNLATLWLDGSIVDVAGSKYFVDKKAGNNVLITGYDFPAGWVKGFPYKSAATIDIFGQTGVPVVSLYQNFDYANTYFCRHVAQVVDGNGVETSQAYVCDIVVYSAPLTGDDLTEANTYYGTPAESGTAVWVSKAGNDTTGNGSKTNPYLTINKATSVCGTNPVYIKSGSYTETAYLSCLGIVSATTLTGLGLVEVKSTSGSQVIMTNPNAGNTITINNLLISANGRTGISHYSAVAHNTIINRCYFNDFLSLGISSTNVDNTQIINNCIFKRTSSGGSPYAVKTASRTDVSGSLFVGNIRWQVYSVVRNIKNNLFNYPTLTDGQVTNLGSADCSIIGNTFITRYKGVTFTHALDSTFNADISYNSFIASSLVATEYLYAFITNEAFSGIIFNIHHNTFSQPFTSALYGVTKACVFLNTKQISHIDNNLFKQESISRFPFNSFGVPTETLTKHYIRFNGIYSKSETGVGITICDEETNTAINAYPNCQIIGNVMYGNRFYNPASTGTIHAILPAWGKNHVVNYNYVNGFGMGIVLKGKAAAYDLLGSGINYNIIVNCNSSIWIRGVSFTENVVYNSGNTIYLPAATSGSVLKCDRNSIVDDLPECNHVVFKNTLIYCTNPYALFSLDSYSLVNGCDVQDSVVNYNSEPTIWIIAGETNYATLALAQAAGLLAGTSKGTFVFTDVNLEKFYPVNPVVGTVLDSAYDDGLDISTAWGNDTTLPVIVTKQQAAAWDCGAYVH